jgi:hypothetical protein
MMLPPRRLYFGAGDFLVFHTRRWSEAEEQSSGEKDVNWEQARHEDRNAL